MQASGHFGFLGVHFMETAVRGFHVYKSDWSPKEGEILETEIENINIYDKFAVCVKKACYRKVAHGRLFDFFFPMPKCLFSQMSPRANLRETPVCI